MDEQLKSCTIVPRQFYVERDADRQLKSIIDEMERPGYVLVSRQMGKTNLLLHTKEIFENDREVYVYIDFSTVDDLNERDFFRNVIDTAIETHYKIFNEANAIISSLRQESNLSNQKQYIREIRILLRYVDKLVFIFDEIDALTKTNYSDKVFSQIRSDYFQRVNFKELHNLTYILSGVIEPKDIIKNPNISPFNIGQKIYLDDFTEKEFNSFVDKTHIPLEENVRKRLFYWTSGNPRMTWDICVSVQNIEHLSVSQLDAKIGEKYFKSYDIAPIDTIRDMVSKDKLLREALVQLYYGKSNELGNSLKQKLYLAGIVNYRNNDIIIKNPIVEKALSLDWVLKLQNTEPDYLDRVYDCIYIRHDYLEAIRILEKMVLLNPSNKKECNKIYLYLGVSYYRTVKFSKALSSLQKIDRTEDTAEEVIQANLLEGYIHVNQDETSEALECFDRNITIGNEKKINNAYIDESKLGKAEAMIESKEKQLILEAKSLLISFITKGDLNTINIPLLPKAHYLLSRVKVENDEPDAALEELDAALMCGTYEEKPFLLYQKLLILKDEVDKRNTVQKILTSLDKLTDVQVLENFDYTLKLDVYTLCLILSELILHFKEFDKEVTQKLKMLNESKEAAYSTICKSLIFSDEKNTVEFARYMLSVSKDENWNFGTDHLFNAYLAIFQKTRKIEDALEFYQYMKDINFDQKNYPSFDSRFASEMLVNVIFYYIFQKNDLPLASEAVKMFEKNYGYNTDPIVKFMSLRKDYARYAISACSSNDLFVFKFGGLFLLKVRQFLEKEGLSIDTKLLEDLRAIRHYVQEHQSDIFEKFRFLMKSYKRNMVVLVRYQDSTVSISKKFKDVEEDVRYGMCYIQDGSLYEMNLTK